MRVSRLRGASRDWLIALAVASAFGGSAGGSCVGAETALAETQQALAQGRAEAAMAGLSTLAASHPNCLPGVLLRARAHAARGQAREAETLYLHACELAPAQPEPFFQLGVFYDGRQQHARAAEQFRKVLGLAPGDPQAYDYLGLSLEALGEFDKAESAYRMGLASNSGPRSDPMLHYNYGRYLLKRGRLADSQRHLDEAVKRAPGVRAVHYERAQLALRLGTLQSARAHAERALQTADPRGVILDMQVHYLLSRIYRGLGETDLAARYTALSQQAEIPLDARRQSGR